MSGISLGLRNLSLQKQELGSTSAKVDVVVGKTLGTWEVDFSVDVRKIGGVVHVDVRDAEVVIMWRT